MHAYKPCLLDLEMYGLDMSLDAARVSFVGAGLATFFPQARAFDRWLGS